MTPWIKKIKKGYSVSLTEDQWDHCEDQARRLGLSSISQYIQKLIDEDIKKLEVKDETSS